jgi:hypothetical protein
MTEEPTVAPVRRSLVVHDIARLRAALEFQRDEAPEMEYRDTLMRQVAYLLTGNYGGADELHLSEDSAKHSFGFSFRKDGQPVSMCGGIILHGLGDPLSTSLDSGRARFHWSIHT